MRMKPSPFFQINLDKAVFLSTLKSFDEEFFGKKTGENEEIKKRFLTFFASFKVFAQLLDYGEEFEVSSNCLKQIFSRKIELDPQLQLNSPLSYFEDASSKPATVFENA